MTSIESEKMLEDKLNYSNTNSERKEAFVRLEHLRRKGTVSDDDEELAAYRKERYEK